MYRQFFLLIIFMNGVIASRAQADSSVIATLPDGPLKEVSGVAASQKHPGIYYVHNDSGDEPRFFAISRDGAVKGEFRFAGDTMHFRRVQDCEDIATGPGPVKGKSYIYLADIGDNVGMRFYIRIYRFEEPALDNSTPHTLPATAVTLKYPDDPKDAETILADPQDKMIYILSKRRDSVSIYMAPVDFGQQDTLVLKPAGKLFFEGKKKEKWLVSGAVSKDGQQVLLKTMNAVYYWKRKPEEHLYETLQRKPISLPYQSKGQEEAICFSQDGKGYIILAEGKQSPIRYFHIP
jgi:hypothetical protein